MTSSSDSPAYSDLYFVGSGAGARGGDERSGPEGVDDGTDLPLGARLRAVDALFGLGELFLPERVREFVVDFPRVLTLFEMGDFPLGDFGGGGGSEGDWCTDASSTFKTALKSMAESSMVCASRAKRILVSLGATNKALGELQRTFFKHCMSVSRCIRTWNRELTKSQRIPAVPLFTPGVVPCLSKHGPNL